MPHSGGQPLFGRLCRLVLPVPLTGNQSNDFDKEMIDVLDVGNLLLTALAVFFEHYGTLLVDSAKGWINTVAGIWLAALGSMLWNATPGRPGRAQFTLRRRGQGRLLQLCIAWSAVQVSTAAPPNDRRPARHRLTEDPSFWALSQDDLRLQALRAIERLDAQRPLERTNTELEPEQFLVDAPAADPAPVAEHISFHVLSPMFEAECLDVAMAFPLLEADVHRVIYDMASNLPTWLSHTVEVQPQPAEEYVTFLLLPTWVPFSGIYCQVIDATAFGMGFYPHYFQGLISRRQILKTINLSWRENPAVFMYGDLAPLADDDIRPAVQGGLIRIFQAGQVVDWCSPLSERLDTPRRWNPNAEMPQPRAGRSPLQIVSDAMDVDVEHTWILLGPRPLFLPTCVESEDGRWLALEDERFDPEPFIDSLQLVHCPGWSIVIQGGQRTDSPTVLKVQHGELLNFVLRYTDDITPTASEAELSAESDEDPDEDDSMGHSGSPGPSETENHDDEPRSHGPRHDADRSRSPRREGGEPENEPSPGMAQELRLADHITVATFDIANEKVEFRHTLGDLEAVFQVWPNTWLQEICGKAEWKPVTQAALLGLVHWAVLLLGVAPGEAPSVHVYSDGSYQEAHNCSGYGAVVLLNYKDDWAHFGSFGDGILGAENGPWGAMTPHPLYAEQVAIVVALLWIGQLLRFMSIASATIHFDNQAAGWGASGQWSPCNEFAVKTRELETYIRRLLHGNLVFQYVRAHHEDPWNEMADVIAKAAARQIKWVPRPPQGNCKAFRNMDSTWLLAAEPPDGQHVLPIKAGRWMEWNPTAADSKSVIQPEQLVPTVSGTSLAKTAKLRTELLTINIQGLKGKHAYVEDQLAWRKTRIAFFQETKDAAGMIRTTRYVRFASPAAGHWGTAIWISKEQGAFDLNERPVFIDDNDTTVVHSGPRLLFLKIVKAGLQLILFSAHIPHEAREQERRDTLADLDQQLSKVRGVDLILGGVDANGRPPPDFAQVTGGLEYGEPDPPGRQFADLLHRHGLWIPSTFTARHQGPSHTFQHLGGNLHRIDFIIVGGEMSTDDVMTAVVADFDTANTVEDHRPLGASLSAWTGPISSAKKLYRPKFDRQRLCTEEGKALVKTALECYQVPAWTTDVNQHCQHLQDYLQDILEKHFVMPAGGLKASYISPQVWEWRAAKLRLKLAASHRRKMWDAAKECAYQRWAHGTTFSAGAVPKQQLLYQLAASAITFTTARIKRQVYDDKRCFLQGLVRDGLQSVGQILHRVRAHGLGGKKNRVSKKPLPRLVDAEGNVAESREQRDAVWLEHFGNQECGRVLPIDVYLRQEATAGMVNNAVPWSIEDLPTLAETEEVIRQAPIGKAMGLDNVPGEIVRAAPAQMAAVFHPLVVKSLATLSQPVQWRGGILHAAWKGAGEIDQPANHRSLFVSSVLAKAYHKLMRNRGQGALHEVLHGLHLGSRRGAPIGFASMSLVAHIRRCQLHKHSYAALFIDTTAAYYRVIRQAALGPLDRDENVAKLLDKFGMAPEDMHTLLELVQSGGLMKEAGNSAVVQAACADFHRQTWCVSAFSAGDSVALTATGSRPGESWADAIFAYIYARTLGTIIERADGEDLLTYLPADSNPVGLPGPSLTEACMVRDSTWADDSVIPVSDENPVRLADKIKRVSSIALATLEEFGLAPNLKPGKTAVMVHLCGPGSQQAKRSLTAGKKAELYLHDLDVRVQITPQYTHLGGVLDAKLSLKAEAMRRLALLGDAFDQGRKLLFQNCTIPLHTRVQLYEASVRSTLFNLSLWVPCGDSWRRLCGGYTRCPRRVLAAEIKGEALYKVPAPLVHIATDSWELKHLARRSRLGLLCAMSLKGPAVLWAQLRAEQSWLRIVRDDLNQLAKFDDTWPDQTCSWQAWETAICANPNRFKLRVKQMLKKQHVADMERYKSDMVLWAMYRQARGDEHGNTEKLKQWQCRMCHRCLGSKGGLGAHFFKTHRRCADYRKVAKGTFCKGCGTEFWSLPRLSIHLRDTPRCVRALRAIGEIAPELAPGLGSKKWRQLEIEQFTPAPTFRRDEPCPVESGRDWSDEARAAYKALCFMLFDKDNWTNVSEVFQAILEILTTFPLYYSEEQTILEQIRVELLEVQAAAPEELWGTESTCHVLEALEHPLPLVDDHRTRDSNDGALTLDEFQRKVATISWEHVLPQTLSGRETPGPTSEKLYIEWDARDSVCRDVGEALAAARDIQSIIPEKLRTVWSQVLTRTDVCISAPTHFWDFPIAKPFLALRADCI
ncbi:unnamed protein product [Symbiodinium sp. CCMP2592]|nr:unnamed protein product [Symbiodinium sp. CCMP2592]